MSRAYDNLIRWKTARSDLEEARAALAEAQRAYDSAQEIERSNWLAYVRELDGKS